MGFAYHHLSYPDGTSAPGLTIGFVDVPGHTDFINNALAGIGAVDFALLVVAADDGIMPQTREHLTILDLLGVSGCAIVITKTDRVSSDRIAATRREISAMVQATVFADSPVFPVSSRSGSGMDSLLAHLESLLHSDSSRPPQRARLPRFPIDRAFTVKGIGTVVTGTVIAGELDSAVELVHSGSGAPVRIKGIRHDRFTVQSACAGERLAINISLPHHQVERGDWLLDRQLYHPTNRIDARLRLLAPINFNSGVRFHFYHGTAHHLVRIRKLGEASSPYYQLYSDAAILANHGDRFILRDPACERTIGGGTVVDTVVPRRGRESDSRLEFLKFMDQDDYPALNDLLESQAGGVSLERFARCRNCRMSRVEELVTRLTNNGVPFSRLEVDRGEQSILLHDSYLKQAGQEIIEKLVKHHRENPSHAGILESHLSRLVVFERSHLLLHAIVKILLKQRQIKRSGTLLHLPDHRPTLSREEQLFADQIRPLMLDTGLVPPRTRELADMTGIKLDALERILAAARKTGNLVQVAGNRHYLPETIRQLAEFTESLAGEQETGFTVIEFRDRLGIGRNLCIEILEYFDRAGYTVRVGNNRQVRTASEKLFNDPDNIAGIPE